jgi:hypothetical protein
MVCTYCFITQFKVRPKPWVPPCPSGPVWMNSPPCMPSMGWTVMSSLLATYPASCTVPQNVC